MTDADKDDTGRYKIEIENASGIGTCEVPIKVKGQWPNFPQFKYEKGNNFSLVILIIIIISSIYLYFYKFIYNFYFHLFLFIFI